MPAIYEVDIIESERGWGQKIDATHRFHNAADAQKFVDDINSENDKDYVPDIYWRADPPRLVNISQEEYEKLYPEKKTSQQKIGKRSNFEGVLPKIPK